MPDVGLVPTFNFQLPTSRFPGRSCPAIERSHYWELRELSHLGSSVAANRMEQRSRVIGRMLRSKIPDQ